MENPDSVRVVEKTVTSVKSVNQEKVTLANQKNTQNSKTPKPKFLEHLRRGFSPSQPSKKTKKNANLQRRKPTEEELAEARRGRERDARKARRESPLLRFTAEAWAKIGAMRDLSGDECGGFGITPNFPDLVEDFVMVRQDVTPVTVEFDGPAIADFTDDMVDRGFHPDCHQFMRIWIHTHPNMPPTPSAQDEETFEAVFGECDYAIMFILSTDGTYYCRLQTNVGIPTEQKIDVEVDYSAPFGPSDVEAWKKEFDEKVSSCGYGQGHGHSYVNSYGYGNWPDDDDIVSSWANWSPKSAAPASSETIKEVNGPEFFSLLSEEEICAVEAVLKCEYKDDPALWDLAAAVMSYDDIEDIDEISEDTLVLLVKEEVRGPELAKLLDFDVGVDYGYDDDDDAYASGFASGVGGGLVTGFDPEAGDAVKILPAKETSSRFAK